jgi:tRNA nucleotidyltransferase (CCA-adding enzyme)
LDAVRMGLSLRAAHGYKDGDAEGLLEEILASGECYRIDMLAIGGEDLVALGIPRGPMLGAALEAAYSAVIERRVPNEREALLSFLSNQG